MQFDFLILLNYFRLCQLKRDINVGLLDRCVWKVLGQLPPRKIALTPNPKP